MYLQCIYVVREISEKESYIPTHIVQNLAVNTKNTQWDNTLSRGILHMTILKVMTTLPTYYHHMLS